MKPVLPGDSDLSRLLYPVTKSKLFDNIQHETTQTGITYFGGFIQVTYHPDERDLIKTFLSIWHFEDETRDAAAFTYQPTSTTASQSSMRPYAQLLGITPDNMVGKTYVLARYWKNISKTTMTNADFSNLTSSAVSSDATSDKITELFSEYGTHYVSGYEIGDLIYQVFVYDKEIGSKDILKFPFQDPAYSFGSKSYAFRQLTQPRKGDKGFSREAGRILSASGDAALKNIIPKLKDDIYRVAASIFMFPVSPSADKMTDTLTKTIPIRVFFKPIVNKLLTTESPSKSTWNDVLSATVFQKFGKASLPNFPTTQSLNVEGFYGSFNPDLVTSTATNYITITQVNFKLDDFVVSDPKFVTHLFIYADVLEISETAQLRLPGSRKIFLVCREFVASSSGNKVPEIIVGSHANSEPVIKIIAKRFRGILKLTQSKNGKHYTYANEYVYKTVKDPNLSGQFTVKEENTKKLLYPDKQTAAELYDNTGTTNEARWLHQSLVNSLELTVTSVESILTVRASSQSVKTASESLNWVTETLTRSAKGSSPLSPDLEMVLGRVLLLGKTQLTEYARSRLIVPRLNFPQYQPLYERLLTAVSNYETTYRTVSTEIQRRRLVETTTNSLQELNRNVKSIGSFLVEQAEVNAQHQDDVAKTQQAVHDLEKDQISRKQGEADKLLQEILKIQNDVKTTGDALIKALKQYEKEQIISAVLNVAEVIGSLFTGGVGLANIDKKLTGIVRIAEKLKNVVTIIEQVSKLYDLGRNLRNDIGTINRALENIPSTAVGTDSFPTELEWIDFDTDVQSFTTPGGFLPGQVAGEALDFQRAAKRLSARGRRYVNIAANIAERKYKQIQIEMQRDLAKRQSNRLRALKTRLTQNDLSNHDAKTTDLFEIGNIIKMKENQVRSQLIQTFVSMDAALQYYYLQKPTLVTSYDTMAIQVAAVRQMQSSISALENFPSRPVDLSKPIDFTVPNVAVNDLLSKEGYTIPVPLSSLPFRDYVRVRVLKIEVRAENILESADDTAYIQATALGESFQDRDLDRNPRIFSTTPTEYRFVYNIKTGKSVVDVNPSPNFVNKFIQVTPFDDWVFRFPKVTTNKGIRFSTKLTTLRIKFYVNVIFHPPPSTNNDQLLHRRLSDDVLGSKDKLLTDLSGRSLVREWDATMAVSAERVNELWKNQYDADTNAGFVKSITTARTLASDSRSFRVETRVMMKVGPPIIQFVRNNQDRATLKIKIKSAVMEYWEFSKRRKTEDNYNETATLSDGSEISGTMNLLQVRGSLTKDSRVVLDLSNGVFEVLELPLKGHLELTIRNQIQLFFNTKLKSTDFELARITYEDKLTPSSLVPDKFYLATGGFATSTSGYGTLFIFFKTRSASATATEQTKRDFNDPLSIDKKIIPNKFEVALFISNRIIFKDIIKEEIKNKFGFGVHTDVLPGQSVSPSQQSLYVKGDQGASRSLPMRLHFSRYKSLSFTFTIPGNSLTAKPFNKGQKLQVHWVNSNLAMSIPYPSHQCGGIFCHDTTEHETVTFTTNFVRNFVPSIDRDLTISYTEEAVSGSASSSVSSITEWWRGSEFRTAKNTITSTVDNYLSGLRFNFQSISAFAITQVLFPNKKVFYMTEVYIPGDMLILGTVNTSPTPAAK